MRGGTLTHMLGGTVAIASGLDEAVDAWVSANYILGTSTAANAQETMGTIDLGGGSIQVPRALSVSNSVCLSCLHVSLSFLPAREASSLIPIGA